MKRVGTHSLQISLPFSSTKTSTQSRPIATSIATPIATPIVTPIATPIVTPTAKPAATSTQAAPTATPPDKSISAPRRASSEISIEMPSAQISAIQLPPLFDPSADSAVDQASALESSQHIIDLSAEPHWVEWIETVRSSDANGDPSQPSDDVWCVSQRALAHDVIGKIVILERPNGGAMLLDPGSAMWWGDYLTPPPPDPRTPNAVFKCVETNNSDKLQALLTAPQGPASQSARVLMEERNDRGDTPLHMACRGGWTETAKALVRNGACLTAFDSNSHTPFGICVTAGHRDTLEAILMEAVAHRIYLRSALETVSGGATPLMLAVSHSMRVSNLSKRTSRARSDASKNGLLEDRSHDSPVNGYQALRILRRAGA